MAGDSGGYRVFISYSHRDHDLKDQLLDHLSPMIQSGLIQVWNDRLISPGTDWQKEIEDRICTSDIVLLLISRSFMGSGYCTGVELQKALELHESKKAIVIPVILREVVWNESSFAHLQALPPFGKAVTSWGDRDRAFMETAKGIRNILPSLQREPRSDTPATTDYQQLIKDHTYFLNHTSFLREKMQQKFQKLTGIPINHYDIRVIVDSYRPDALDAIDHVEYLLDETYPKPVQVVGSEARQDKFMLKELANGEYVLFARLYFKNGSSPVVLQRYITLWKTGPTL